MIKPSAPTEGVVQAPQTITYDSVWITSLTVMGSPSAPTKVVAEFLPWKSGTEHLLDGPEHIRRLELSDLFAEAAGDPELAAAVGTLIAALENQAKKKGVI